MVSCKTSKILFLLFVSLFGLAIAGAVAGFVKGNKVAGAAGAAAAAMFAAIWITFVILWVRCKKVVMLGARQAQELQDVINDFASLSESQQELAQAYVAAQLQIPVTGLTQEQLQFAFDQKWGALTHAEHMRLINSAIASARG